MITLIKFLIASLGSFEVSQLLSAYIDVSSWEMYKAIGEKYNISERSLKESYDAEYIMYDKNTKIINYIPLLNLIKAHILLNKKRTLHQDIIDNVYDYFPEISPKYIKEQKECGVLPIGKEKKEYFVGYFDYDNTPITIWFTYDGIDIYTLDISASRFRKLPNEAQAYQLMFVLYNIYIGNEKDYIFSKNIYQIFNEFLISCLKETFENNNPYYEIENLEIERTRLKP